MDSEKRSETAMEKIAAFIIDKRKAFYLIFAIAAVYCVISIPKVRINNDIAAFLPADTETRVGLDIMEDEFTTYASAQVMLSNVTFDQAQAFADRFSRLDGVMMVSFDDTPDHYANSSALLMVSFKGSADDEKVVRAMDSIKESLNGYDVYYNSEVGSDYSNTLATEMAIILIIAAVVVAGVLLTTSKSYLELIVFLIVFVVAAVLNMGTNFLLGQISFVTNSVAIILQLALAVDYAIILCHRYIEEHENYPAREADVKALSKAIVEISSSSLTTIAGLVALTTMQFRLGFDLGIVLIKGIFCSLITVFVLMPGLLMLFSRGMDKTLHRSFIPDISALGRGVVKVRYIMLPIFLVVFVLAFWFSNKSEYVFSTSSIETNHPSVSRIATDKIADTFGTKNTMAILVPKGDYESEKSVIRRVNSLPNVVGALGLASVKIDDEHVLTDKFTPRQFAELADIDIELSRLLFQAYGFANEEYSAVFQDVDDYSAPLINVFRFLLEQRDLGVVSLSAEQNRMLDELNGTLQDALIQLEGENWSRIVFTVDLPDEGEETVKLLDDMRNIASDYYGSEPVLVGNATVALDLNTSFSNDNIKINLLTALFVMIILLFTFQSVGLPFLLILTIQGSIFINFSVPYIISNRLFFLSYLIISAIQMGATIDYAILVTNRYQALKRQTDNRSAIIEAVNQSFPTIFTSGTIMTVAGFLIGWISTEPIIASIGSTLGRGTLISMILVLTVLPQALYVGDVIIEKTALTLRLSRREHIRTDEVRMEGRIKGHVSGYIDGDFKGVIKGDINASFDSDTGSRLKPQQGPGKEDTQDE